MTTCYRPLENSIFNVSDSEFPCSGTTPTGCCVYGDFCMSNGICHYTKSTTVGSGYYLQSCSDSTFQSSVGQETFHCTTLDYPDVVYNITTGLWACCSSDAATGLHCSIATNETWAAPAPDALATIATIELAPASTASTSSTSSTNPPQSSVTSTPASLPSTSSPSPPTPSTSSLPSVSSSSSSFSKSSSTSSSSTLSSSESSNTAAAASMPANPSPSTASSHRTGLTVGTDAGIGIGVVLGVIVLIALIFFAVKHLRKRKRTRHGSAVLFGGPDPTMENIHNEHRTEMRHGAGVDVGYGYGHRPHRFTGEPRFPQELSNVQVPYEAPGRQRYEFGTGHDGR